MDGLWMLTEETLEIWYQDDKGWLDLLSKRGGIDVGDGDNLYDADVLSWLNPDANATALNPLGYSQHHTLVHVAADHEVVIAIY